MVSSCMDFSIPKYMSFVLHVFAIADMVIHAVAVHIAGLLFTYPFQIAVNRPMTLKFIAIVSLSLRPPPPSLSLPPTLLSPSLPLSPPPPLCLCLCLSVCLSLCLSLSLSHTHTHTHTHARPRWSSGKESASSAEDVGIELHFPDRITPVTKELALKCLLCPPPPPPPALSPSVCVCLPTSSVFHADDR